MKDIAISVIVPVYNAEETLRQCVDSILSQEYRDFELLLVDDGSKDGSPRMCDEYAVKDERVKVFHKENGGVSAARNLGLDHARGEWITFVDSDDYISQSYFDCVENREEDIIFLDYNTKRDGHLLGFGSSHHNIQQTSMRDFLSSVISTNYVRGPVMKFYRHSLLKELRFHEDMRIAEDSCFVIDYLSQCSTMAFLPKAYYIICAHDAPQEQRYPVTTEYAANSLLHLKNAFEKLNSKHQIGRDKFMPYIGFFKAASVLDRKNNPNKWWGNEEIRNIYRYVWPSLSCKQKVQLIAARMLRK